MLPRTTKWFVIFLALALSAKTFANGGTFNPLATVNSQTIEKGSFALGRSPLGNINSTFLTSSLNYGLFSRFEIGASPIFFTVEEHKYNYNVKLNFWDGDIFKWSFMGGESVFQTEIETNGEVERPDVNMSFIQLATNIHIPNARYKLGLSATRSCGYIASKNSLVKVFSFRCEDETGFDLQVATRENQWITLGQGRNREAGITPFESVVDGYGVSYSFFRPKKAISRPSIGIYHAENGNNLFLLTTTFYEE